MRNPDLGPILILGFYEIFIKFGCLGWIRIGSALLNALQEVKSIVFVFVFLIFSVKTCVENLQSEA